MTRYNATSKPPVKPQGSWLDVSHDMTWIVGELADRDDLVVKISPDAGYDDTAYHNGELIKIPVERNGEIIMVPAGEQHPGITFQNLGIIEINGNHLPDNVDPGSMKPSWRSDWERYPVVSGILIHEAAHAHFSHWKESLEGKKLTREELSWIGAATILEESRVEAQHMGFRPQDQMWLQAMATNLVAAETSATIRKMQAEITANGGELPKPVIARAAGLIVARIDAGSVEESDATEKIKQLTINAFGEDTYQQLRDIWVEAQSASDTDTQTMMRLGREWFELTGDDGGEPDGEEIDGELSPLEQALIEAASQAIREASGEAARSRRRRRIAAQVKSRNTEAQAQQQAKRQAVSVFAAKGKNYNHPITGYRDPTPREVSRARAARKLLEAAYVPERAVTPVTRAVPPGRLSVRAAQQLNAQRQAGLLPNAEPFRYKDRKHIPTPPLKVGIVQDVSGSQSGAAAAAVSGAWSLAKATQMIVDAQVAMVSFGDEVHAIIKPYTRTPKVPVLSTDHGTDYFTESVMAVEGQLDLTRSGSARLLVILTDGYLNQTDLEQRDGVLKRLTDHGVKVLWMVTSGSGEDEYVPVPDTRVHVFRKASGNYDIIPDVIIHEAVNALKR